MIVCKTYAKFVFFLCQSNVAPKLVFQFNKGWGARSANYKMETNQKAASETGHVAPKFGQLLSYNKNAKAEELQYWIPPGGCLHNILYCESCQ